MKKHATGGKIRIPEVRNALLDEQHGRCAICNRVPLVACLDHDHVSGQVRGVLCRSCNAAEGKMKNVHIRVGNAQVDFSMYLRNLADYLDKHKANPTGMMHPSHGKPKAKAKGAKFATLKGNVGAILSTAKTGAMGLSTDMKNTKSTKKTKNTKRQEGTD